MKESTILWRQIGHSPLAAMNLYCLSHRYLKLESTRIMVGSCNSITPSKEL